MPTVREIFERVVKTKDNQDEDDIEGLTEALGIQYHFNRWGDDFAPLKVYWVAPFRCSSEWVGQRAYFLNDEPIAISVQMARRSEEQFYFVSEEAANKMRMFLYERMAHDNERPVELISFDHDVPDTFSVSFASAFIDRKGTYQGRPVEVLHKPNEFAATVCDVRFEDGSVETVKAEDVKLPLRLA